MIRTLHPHAALPFRTLPCSRIDLQLANKPVELPLRGWYGVAAAPQHGR
jgi:hypothetical protein